MDNKKIVTLSNLSHYDEKIKIWVSDQILRGEGLVFINKLDLPQPGKDKTLYITEDSICKWDESSSSYITISGGSSGELIWKPIK